LEIVNITPEAIPACGEMMNAAFHGTDMVERLARMYELQPENFFMAREGDQIVGGAGAMNYGPFAAIGLVSVHPEFQRRGIGTGVMERLVEALEAQGCPMIFLDATAMGAPVYTRLGFIEDGRTYRYSRPDHRPSGEPLPDGIAIARPDELNTIIALDSKYFGTARPSIYHQQETYTPGRIFVARDESGAINGILCAQNAILGPWVADSPIIAEKLLRAALTLEFPEEVRVIFPAANPETELLLSRYGFQKARDIAHMRRGGVREPRDIPRYYGQASFMLG